MLVSLLFTHLDAKISETNAMTMLSSLLNEIQDTAVSGPTKRQLRALTRITDLFVAGSGRHSNKQVELFD